MRSISAFSGNVSLHALLRRVDKEIVLPAVFVPIRLSVSGRSENVHASETQTDRSIPAWSQSRVPRALSIAACDHSTRDTSTAVAALRVDLPSRNYIWQASKRDGRCTIARRLATSGGYFELSKGSRPSPASFRWFVVRRCAGSPSVIRACCLISSDNGSKVES